MKPCLEHPASGQKPARLVRLVRRLVVGFASACLLLAACSGPTEDRVGGEPDDDTPDDLQAGESQKENEVEREPRRILDLDNIPEVEATELAEPDTFVPEAVDELRATVEEAIENPDVGILDVVGLRDEGPTAGEIASFGDGNRRSGAGELITLDEAAALACANTEIAIQHLDAGEQDAAVERVAKAAEWAALAENRVFPLWAEELDAASAEIDGETSVDPVPLIGLFAACLDGGYDI